ncbi:MAG: hypothetical protein ACI9R3_004004 [Verrucomicrobiales bacterium]|jgi:hypothetical protein
MDGERVAAKKSRRMDPQVSRRPLMEHAHSWHPMAAAETTNTVRSAAALTSVIQQAAPILGNTSSTQSENWKHWMKHSAAMARAPSPPAHWRSGIASPKQRKAPTLDADETESLVDSVSILLTIPWALRASKGTLILPHCQPFLQMRDRRIADPTSRNGRINAAISCRRLSLLALDRD